MGQGRPATVLNHEGAETRRSVVLVLHESSERWITHVTDWTARSLCAKELLAETAQ
jgi:hypothetical protein